MLRAINFTHRLFRILSLLLNVLCSFKSVEEIIAEGFVKVKRYTRDDFGKEGGGAAVRNVVSKLECVVINSSRKTYSDRSCFLLADAYCLYSSNNSRTLGFLGKATS